jgi:hypothetical protein
MHAILALSRVLLWSWPGHINGELECSTLRQFLGWAAGLLWSSCAALPSLLDCAGVATAFAAPIGGLLFTVEEGVSFYSTSIFWRGFLSTGIGVFTLHFLVECAVGLRSPPEPCRAGHCDMNSVNGVPGMV